MNEIEFAFMSCITQSARPSAMINVRWEKHSSALEDAMIVLRTAIVALIACTAAAQAAECPRAGTLGTSRILGVDAAQTPRVGLKSFPHTLPLDDHEVVLTFDDGPWPPTTSRVLATLARECVRATFFLIGKHASEHPELVRRIAAEGHTVGHHTWSHRSPLRIKPAETAGEIDRGISAVETALHGTATTTPSTPFFRFPGFEIHAGHAGSAAIARHHGVRRGPLGQRLGSDDAEAAIEAADRPPKTRPQGNYPAA